MLPDRSWRISYSSNENNPIAEFYIPALECAVQYDRKSGFFNSAILSRVARGLGAMLHNQGKIRLIMGCQFSPEDLDAIEKGYALREIINDRLTAELEPPENFVQLKHLEILSWLIETGSLDIKIAIPMKANGMPTDENTATIDRHHIFHEKVGIFTDKDGNKLVFSGSNNESVAGWEYNVESFHVYCGWEGGRDGERVDEEVARFDRLWHGLAPNVSIFDLPEAVLRKLLTHAPKSIPDWSKEDEVISNKEQVISKKDDPEENLLLITSNLLLKPTTNPEEETLFDLLANLHNHPGCLDFCLKSIPISPWAHQLKILRRVANNFPCNFLIADEVGLGKTIETGLILKYLLTSQKVQRVLLLVPASVQNQWQQELREKFNLNFWSYSQGEFTDPHGTTIPTTSNPWNTTNLILASSHLIRRSDRAKELLAAEPWDLVILDEAHHARRRSPQQRKDTPNRLLELLQKLKERTRSLILLSATPMQIDPVEIFDLLNLLGLSGHWSYSENFCNYFATLSGEIDRDTLNFWQQMSTDYFKRGGKPCPRLNAHLNQQDKLLAHRLQDTWQTGRKSIDYKQCIQDKEFIAASRQYLTTNTPLKDLMFRHTRDTLREYYRHGILDRDIPTRIVSDNAIVLEPLREVKLYQAVSDYVRHFYQLAQKENRKALGFLMTLYRKRLTSSFYAVKESLKRRLEGISITPDDLNDIDDADDSIIQGLESFFAQPTDPREIAELEKILRQFENTGEDSKLSNFLIILRQELNQRESAIVFTQYTDTMDYLRDNLYQIYGNQVACYSGRGGEIYQGDKWVQISKEKIKSAFRAGEIKVLLCTESACEGLNLQTCSVLLNYDMPWNPMRVEQRIGRIDRIGQLAPTVRIHNFYYDGTVEAKVYRKLRDRIDAFQSVVGNLQPILAQVPNFIEQAVMSADPAEEGVLLAEFDRIFDAPPLRPAVDDLVAMDVVADLAEIAQPLPPSPITSSEIERLFTTSNILKSQQINFELVREKVWSLSIDRQQYQEVTFDPATAEAQGIRLMSYGEPLFVDIAAPRGNRLLSFTTI
jgi:SNF2 family DNA or RNA helicase